ncbi:MAG: hypothetical protein GTO18_07530, partial [Anaerolineales bacterium]|nr:hypothetical protein [Anaerolineales bacterium]
MKPLTKYLVVSAFGFLIIGILAQIYMAIQTKKPQAPRSDPVEIELWTNDTKAEWVHA